MKSSVFLKKSLGKPYSVIVVCDTQPRRYFVDINLFYYLRGSKPLIDERYYPQSYEYLVEGWKDMGYELIKEVECPESDPQYTMNYAVQWINRNFRSWYDG